MTKGYIKYAGEKISSVRKLQRTQKPIVHAGGIHPPRELHKIIGGFVALDSDWVNSFGNKFEASINGLTNDEQIDIGCCLNKGSFIVTYDDTTTISHSSKDIALNYFFIKLITKLQEVGTVPCIDFEKYLNTIDGE